jgi:hypothetical protein
MVFQACQTARRGHIQQRRAPAVYQIVGRDHAASQAYVDPLGLALFGPTVGVELGASDFSALLHARWFSGGLLAKSMFLDDDGEEFGFSYGLGLAGRYYPDGNLEGLHAGVVLELLVVHIEQTRALVASTDKVFVPSALSMAVRVWM